VPSRRAQRRDGTRRGSRADGYLTSYIGDAYRKAVDAYFAAKIRPADPPAPLTDHENTPERNA
jgi:hypothetical protein